METHLHLVASAPDLVKDMKEFKSYTARRIVDYLEETNQAGLLEQLRELKRFHKTQSAYQVWQEGSHPQQIGNDGIMRQKLEYTHNNPVRRSYVDEPAHWRHSSARNYAGMPGLIDVVTDWQFGI